MSLDNSQADGRLSVVDWSRFAKENSRFVGSDQEAKARQILLQNERLEMQISILKGERIATSDVEKWAGEMVSASKRILLSIPATLASQLVGLPVPDAEERLKEAIVEAMAPLLDRPWEDL